MADGHNTVPKRGKHRGKLRALIPFRRPRHGGRKLAMALLVIAVLLGIGRPWLQMLRDLSPFKINSTVVRNGSVHFRAHKGQALVDVYLSDVEATIDNLGNIRDETDPLVSTIQATALVMDHARLECKMTLDPFSYYPTFHLTLRLLGLDVTKLNELARAYGKFDFKRGWFDVV